MIRTVRWILTAVLLTLMWMDFKYILYFIVTGLIISNEMAAVLLGKTMRDLTEHARRSRETRA